MNYDSASWDLITQELMTYHDLIHPFNRAQLLDDSFNIACAGKIEFSVPLNLTKYLKFETEVAPLKSGLFYLKKINSVINDNGSRQLLQNYIDEIQFDFPKREKEIVDHDWGKSCLDSNHRIIEEWINDNLKLND